MASPTRTRRPPTTPARRRAAQPQRRGVAGGWLQRRQPEKRSPLQKAWGAVSGAIPGRSKNSSPATSSGSGRRGKLGGLAMLAGAAGLIFKNRDKVSSRMHRGGSGAQSHP